MDMSFIFWGTFGLFSFFWLIQIEFLWTYTGFCVNISFHFSRRNSQSVQFSHSVVSNSLRFHRLKHDRLSCPSPTPGAFSNSGPSNRWQPNHLILCCPLLLQPSIFPSIRVFPSESVLPIRWPKYWSFTFSISPSNECSWLVSFRIDWLDLLAVQGTLKILLQHHSSEA